MIYLFFKPQIGRKTTYTSCLKYPFSLDSLVNVCTEMKLVVLVEYSADQLYEISLTSGKTFSCACKLSYEHLFGSESDFSISFIFKECILHDQTQMCCSALTIAP